MMVKRNNLKLFLGLNRAVFNVHAKKATEEILNNEVNSFERVREFSERVVPEISRERRFDSSEIIYRTGDRGNRLYLILEGSVKLYSRCSNFNPKKDKLSLVFLQLKEGEVFGEEVFKPGKKRDSTALSDGKTKILELKINNIWDVLDKNPKLTLLTIKFLLQRRKRLEEKIKMIFAADVEKKTSCQLLKENKKRPSEEILYLFHWDLAEKIGACRSPVTRVLRGFSKKGIIGQQGIGKIKIDKEKLEKIEDF